MMAFGDGMTGNNSLGNYLRDKREYEELKERARVWRAEKAMELQSDGWESFPDAPQQAPAPEGMDMIRDPAMGTYLRPKGHQNVDQLIKKAQLNNALKSGQLKDRQLAGIPTMKQLRDMAHRSAVTRMGGSQFAGLPGKDGVKGKEYAILKQRIFEELKAEYGYTKKSNKASPKAPTTAPMIDDIDEADEWLNANF